ncbi:MAG: DedA family protein [Selenomonas sp.]|uniref:DedA family protein n=1 Tax=Selenomonas sp. AE3005 TaxID=1485543 RepID=UPI000484B738|nr:DedA family protein [Selenomonas sp. AE3005]MBQ1417383.1 DedA family protein [Selenomonas sp.]MBQ1614565.1 DedA family protein [Selenomonas sp.]MBQ1919245.1 DedA family protein [Selenomonas sp.]MBQ2087812.1 DedA family protein [Selenomonas sp.]MBQ2137224.1 DedA family protein [Selenomonas sp.]
MEQFSTLFLEFIASWGYVAVAILMAAENACIPIPSELILGFAGYLIFADQMTFTGALVAGMVGGMAGSIFAYVVGHRGGRSFVDKYGHYFFVKKSHVDIAQNWFDKYGLKAVFFSRMLPVVRTFISLPAGFAHVDMKKFLTLTFLGSLPWTAMILAAGMMLGKSWEIMLKIGHQASLIFVGVCAVIIVVMYLRYRKRKQAQAKMEIE